MGISQTSYELLPAWGQNLVTTLRGLQLRRWRYTLHTWETLAFLSQSQFWPAWQFQQYQLEQLQRLVSHAFQHSPYYQRLYAKMKINPGLIKSLDDLQILPVISKEEFRRHNDQFFSTHIDRKHMWVSYTSGTTGTPLTAYTTHRGMQERIAIMERLYQWYTPKAWRRRASFTGKLVVNPDRLKPPFHKNNWALSQQLYSSHHLAEKNLPSYAFELEDYAPDQVDGIASPIYVIADYLLRSGRAGRVRPNVIIPTSETLWPFVRERLENGFKSKVANQYGSQEGAPIAYECPDGGFHICPESGIFEIINSNGNPCPPGEIGKLVVTSFSSEGTPLIRYDIGDLAAWRGEDCPCGRNMPLLQYIEGRIEDMFFSRERGIIPRLDSAFKSMPSAIISTQIAQLAIDRFEVRIIPDPATYKAEYGESIQEQLYNYLGRSVRIEIKLAESIKRTAGGKMPAMVNECLDPEVRNAIVKSWNIANINGWTRKAI
jgi:phenylacetate-CoA ligase